MTAGTDIPTENGTSGKVEPNGRIGLLERALVDYIRRYGMTDLAREALASRSKRPQ